MKIVAAIQNQNLLSFVYDGFRRIVEPHTYGMDKKGHMALRAYQIGGGSESGEYVGWKLFHTQEMHGLTAEHQTFAGARQGYKRGDKAFSSIQAEL